jgi:hypothetical protein
VRIDNCQRFDNGVEACTRKRREEECGTCEHSRKVRKRKERDEREKLKVRL